ncbi:hypothetical protein Y032_0058g2878 [Ancylostoma ceylanicum]|uniref:Uncharacterized protein n=1 Tax=Ancylostoma ceylanicum TaxID=53326 RepID=A0A016U3L7_9BILA|nr:hypothetical protein Y032_0058g2878 [Ancylostoma ceylanicum]
MTCGVLLAALQHTTGGYRSPARIMADGASTAQESLKCYGVQARRICAPIGIVGPDSPVVQCTTRAALLQAPLRHQSTLIFFPGSAPDPLRSPFAVRPFYEAQLAPGRRILGPDSLV